MKEYKEWNINEFLHLLLSVIIYINGVTLEQVAVTRFHRHDDH